MNCSTVLNQNTWGVHFNFEEHFTSPTTSPAWLTPLQQRDWTCRGIVVWEASTRVVAHLYAGYALEILQQMRVTETWRSNNFVIGSPTYTLSSERVDGNVTLENQIELSPGQAKDFFDFLNIHKKLLEHVATRDEEAAEAALRDVFRLIAAYGRKVRERKKIDKPAVITKPNILPTFIPRGSYFTVPQAAQMCNATSKQIRAWIRKRKIDALDLPGFGIIIKSEKLYQFMQRKALDLQ